MPRKTRSSWGSNQPAHRKGYRTLRYWADLHDGRGYMRHTKTVKGSKRDGDEELARLRIAHSADRPTPTVGQAWELWVVPENEAMHRSYLDNPRPSKRGSRECMKTSTYAQVKSTWKAHVAPRWANVGVDSVMYSDVQAWLDTKTEQVAKRALGQLALILDKCVINEVVDKNVARYKYRMPTKARKYSHGVFSLEEIDGKLLPAARGELCEASVILSAIGGCRSGESLAPLLNEVTEINVDGFVFAAVDIPRQVNDFGEVSAEADLKNVWSPRVVVIPPPWSHRLLELRNEGVERGEMWLTDNGVCEPVSQSRVRKSYYKCLKKAGMERVQFRSLRRSWRSWISNKGINDRIIEKMMGHSDGTTTGRYYLETDARLIAEELARACDWEAITTRLRHVRDK